MIVSMNKDSEISILKKQLKTAEDKIAKLKLVKEVAWRIIKANESDTIESVQGWIAVLEVKLHNLGECPFCLGIGVVYHSYPFVMGSDTDKECSDCLGTGESTEDTKKKLSLV